MALTVRRVALADLVVDPRNARVHPEENVAAIRSSLARFGQVEPLVVQRGTMRVIGGNGRLETMRSMGWAEADVVEVDVIDAEATALGLALNRTGELATWNDDRLAELLGELRGTDLSDVSGFDAREVDRLIAELEATSAGPVEDSAPPPVPKVAVTRRGDLWHLGDHRLLCGDSTDVGDVNRVMAGAQAALVATDPPYLVDYTGERPNDSGKDWSETYREVEIEDADRFFRRTFENILGVLAPHAAVYCWHAHKRSGEIQRIWRDLGLLDHQQVVWVKPTAVFGRVYWYVRHEPCMMGWRQGSKPPHNGQNEHDSVWEVDWDGLARIQAEHPTSKPVELFARPMRKHTRVGDVVFEPFSGSGSQLIAAEQERRRCRAIELEPAFVDVGVRRWQAATGKSATLEASGRTFLEVAAERGVTIG